MTWLSKILSDNHRIFSYDIFSVVENIEQNKTLFLDYDIRFINDFNIIKGNNTYFPLINNNKILVHTFNHNTNYSIKYMDNIIKFDNLNKAEEYIIFLKNLQKKYLLSPKNNIIPNLSINNKPISLSNQKIDKLLFFKNKINNEILDIIYNQTNNIQNIFINDSNLSSKKLEQFHYYYTDTLLELLEKIYNSNIELDNNQEINKELINNRSNYSQIILLQLTTIYNLALNNIKDFKDKKIENYKKINNVTSYQLKSNIFLDINHNISNNNLHYKCDDYNYYVQIDLMLLLEKNNFDIMFISLYNSDNNYFELFKIKNTDTYFIYLYQESEFKLIDITKIDELNLNKNNNLIKLDNNTIELLNTYISKIENIDFVNKLTSIDIERKNLESILNLTQLEI